MSDKSATTLTEKQPAKAGKPTQSQRAHKAKRSHNRIQPLLDAAAKLFATKGYRETTMRGF